ncbi:MAG: hypothetical protein DRP94_04135 [Candidatus Latescibacterota bacterium]|nr:MAG: hypothetical protein DRP94_04135 [Candidatus Latescibacterota bacterium]
MMRLALCVLALPMASWAITISEEEREGQPVVVMENDLYRAVLAYRQARLPLSYFFKLSGHEEFVMPEKLLEDKEHFHYFGGIIDCIPSTSGEDPEDRKGLLWRVPWDIRLVQGEDSVKFEGRAEISYSDPATGRRCRLRFEKTMVGYRGTSVLEMRYRIENFGEQEARFMLAVHGRIGVGGGWDQGDYFYAPGDSCRLYYTNWPSVLERGVEPPCWLEWPLKEATDYRPLDSNYHIFVYVPADWCAVGDEKYKEAVFFVASPVRIGKGTGQMKMGIFMTTNGYVVEPSLTYCGGPEGWTTPGGTVSLGPGETCEFKLYMAAYLGIDRGQVEGLKEARPSFLVLERPEIRRRGEIVTLKGRIALPGFGKLALEHGRKVLYERDVGPGVVEVEEEVRAKAGKLSLKLKDSLGTFVLVEAR